VAEDGVRYRHVEVDVRNCPAHGIRGEISVPEFSKTLGA
jgi:hypothetical protein